MHILCLGLGHRDTPVELRERLSYPPTALKTSLARFGCGFESRPRGISELAIVSTCHRLELYAGVPEAPDSAGESHAAWQPLVEFLVETRGVPAGEFESHLYRYSGVQAVRQLCRVAAGLDSAILGEPQILGQVAEALEAAAGQGAAGPVLTALFQAAIRAGKRARTQTAIARNPASVSSVAVRLAETAIGDLRAARVLVVGAGEMAELAVEALRLRGVSHVAVANRTRDGAMRLAQRWGGEAWPLERLAEAIAWSDVVIASTGAPHIVITHDMVASTLPARGGRPLIFIDIAVPRDVDPDAARLPGVTCYNVDDLQAGLDGALAERRREIPLVEAIVGQEVAAFEDWRRRLDIVPVIADLRAKADVIRREEVERTLRHLPHLGPAERRRIEALTESLINKLLHEPTVRLKAEAGNGHAAAYAAAVRDLFGLD